MDTELTATDIRDTMLKKAQRAALAGNRKQAERRLKLAGESTFSTYSLSIPEEPPNPNRRNVVSVAFWGVIFTVLGFWLPLGVIVYILGKLFGWWA